MAFFAPLKEVISGIIMQPCEGPKYDSEIAKVWNANLHKKRPLAFVKVMGHADVAETIRFCVENQIEVCVSCGGTSDFSIRDDAVIIDLSMMKNIKVDYESKTAIIEAGAIVLDVDEALHGHNYALPLGSFSQLGVAGMTLMGGLGFLTRSYGLTSDSVVEYDLVTASGDIIKVSDKENEDLFWGMKGFGFNFGVVTSMKFQVIDMPDLIVGGTMYYPLQRAMEVIQALRGYFEEASDNRFTLYILLHVDIGGPELLVRLHYSGTLRRGVEIVKSLQDLTQPYKSTCSSIAHCDFQKQGDYMMPSGRFYQGSAGHFLSDLKDEVIANLIDGIQKIPGDFETYSNTLIYITTVGGKANEVKQESTSFPFRENARYWIGMNGSTNNENNMNALEKWVSSVQDVNAQHGLVPYAGDAEKFQEKLKELKKKYDPHNVFKNNCMNIDPK